METRIVRIFNTYGPRMRLNDGRVLPAFIGQALRGEDLTVFGDGSQTRSFCYVDDLVEGIYRLLLSDETRPVNIGNPDEISIADFAEEIISLTGTDQKVVYKPLPQDDPKQRRPDIRGPRTASDGPPRSAAQKASPSPTTTSRASRKRTLEDRAQGFRFLQQMSTPTGQQDWFAHETAVIDAGCQIGAGTKVGISCIMPGAVLGEGCNIGQNVVVSPDVVMSRNCKVQNNVSHYLASPARTMSSSVELRVCQRHQPAQCGGPPRPICTPAWAARLRLGPTPPLSVATTSGLLPSSEPGLSSRRMCPPTPSFWAILPDTSAG